MFLPCTLYVQILLTDSDKLTSNVFEHLWIYSCKCLILTTLTFFFFFYSSEEYNLRNGKCLNVYLLPVVFVCPEVTLCGWQGIKICNYYVNSAKGHGGRGVIYHLYAGVWVLMLVIISNIISLNIQCHFDVM